MDIKIHFALVGCGRIGARHAENILRFGVLAGVCDIDTSKADSFAETYASKAFYTIEALLASGIKMDVVSICTPNGLHAMHSIASLKTGKHVLCEKPMALTVSDCGRMIQAAEQNNRRLFIIKQNRFNPPVMALKNLIDGNRLGKIYSVQVNCFWNRNEDYYKNTWKGTKDMDGGTLFTQFSHFIDLLYWLIGDVEKVYAFTANRGHEGIIEFEDTGVVALQFYTGVLGTIHYTVNAFAKNMEGSVTVFGEKGTVKVGGQYLNELAYQSLEGAPITDLPKGNTANDYGNYVGSMSNHDKVYANLVDVIQNNASIITNLFDGLKTVEIINKIYYSANKHQA
ncbi:MAG: Gfo/Idh/MocA family oxidoreductase [Chitinophagaceae bacterium]